MTSSQKIIFRPNTLYYTVAEFIFTIIRFIIVAIYFIIQPKNWLPYIENKSLNKAHFSGLITIDKMGQIIPNIRLQN